MTPSAAHARGQLGDAVAAELVGLACGEPGQLRHVDLALFAERAGDQRHVGTTGSVVRHRRPGADRLVIGVRVHKNDPAAGGDRAA